MAKKSSSTEFGQKFLNALLVAVGIYLVIYGVLLTTQSQSWQSFYMASGLGLLVAGTIGFSKIK